MLQITPTLPFTNGQQASIRASAATDAALQARNARYTLDGITVLLNDWSAIFTNSATVTVSCLFIFAALIDFVFSFPMYFDLMSQMTGQGNRVFATIGGLFVIFWAAFASHLMAARFSSSVFTFHVYNSTIYSKGVLPQAAAEEVHLIYSGRKFYVGIIVGSLLLLFVLLLSIHRVNLIEQYTGEDLGNLHRYLPVLCVFIEIISGIYIEYLVRRTFKSIRKFTLKRRFLFEKHRCQHNNNMVMAHLKSAKLNGEIVQSSKDIFDAIHRHELRSFDDSYTDLILNVSMR